MATKPRNSTPDEIRTNLDGARAFMERMLNDREFRDAMPRTSNVTIVNSVKKPRRFIATHTRGGSHRAKHTTANVYYSPSEKTGIVVKPVSSRVRKITKASHIIRPLDGKPRTER